MDFLSQTKASPEDSLFHIIPMPWGQDISNNVEHGPAGIIESSKKISSYDFKYSMDLADYGIYTHENAITPYNESKSAFGSAVEHSLQGIVERKQIPISLGGSHRIAKHIIQKIDNLYKPKPITYVVLDAQLGEVSSVLMGMGKDDRHPNYVNGVRNATKEMVDKAKKSVGFKWNRCDICMVPHLFDKNIYLSIDLGVMDPTIMPAVCDPFPGGYSWDDMISIIYMMAKNNNLIGADLGGYNPSYSNRHCGVTIATLIYKIMQFVALRKGPMKSSKK